MSNSAEDTSSFRGKAESVSGFAKLDGADAAAVDVDDEEFNGFSDAADAAPPLPARSAKPVPRPRSTML